MPLLKCLERWAYAHVCRCALTHCVRLSETPYSYDVHTDKMGQRPMFKALGGQSCLGESPHGESACAQHIS